MRAVSSIQFGDKVGLRRSGRRFPPMPSTSGSNAPKRHNCPSNSQGYAKRTPCTKCDDQVICPVAEQPVCNGLGVAVSVEGRKARLAYKGWKCSGPPGATDWQESAMPPPIFRRKHNFRGANYGPTTTTLTKSVTTRAVENHFGQTSCRRRQTPCLCPCCKSSHRA